MITKDKIIEVAPHDYEHIKDRLGHYEKKCHEYKEKCHELEHKIHEHEEETEAVKRHGKKHEHNSKMLENSLKTY